MARRAWIALEAISSWLLELGTFTDPRMMLSHQIMFHIETLVSIAIQDRIHIIIIIIIVVVVIPSGGTSNPSRRLMLV